MSGRVAVASVVNLTTPMLDCLVDDLSIYFTEKMLLIIPYQLSSISSTYASLQLPNLTERGVMTNPIIETNISFHNGLVHFWNRALLSGY